MAIRFEDKGRDDKPAKKDVNGRTYVAEEPATTPSDAPAEPAAANKRKALRAKPTPTRQG